MTVIDGSFVLFVCLFVFGDIYVKDTVYLSLLSKLIFKMYN